MDTTIITQGSDVTINAVSLEVSVISDGDSATQLSTAPVAVTVSTTSAQVTVLNAAGTQPGPVGWYGGW